MLHSSRSQLFARYVFIAIHNSVSWAYLVSWWVFALEAGTVGVRVVSRAEPVCGCGAQVGHVSAQGALSGAVAGGDQAAANVCSALNNVGAAGAELWSDCANVSKCKKK